MTEIAVHGAAPGRHELEVSVDLSTQAQGTLLGTCQKNATTTFEVVSGSVASQFVKLSAESHSAVPLEVMGTDWIGGPMLNMGWIGQKNDSATGAFFGRVTVVEGTTQIASDSALASWRRTGGETRRQGVFLRGLAKGNHTVRVRFTPDPRVAFGQDVDVDEIVNDSFEREVTFEVK